MTLLYFNLEICVTTYEKRNLALDGQPTYTQVVIAMELKRLSYVEIYNCHY